MAPKARVDTGPSIRSASKSKQRSAAQSNKKPAAASDPYGSSSGSSLASSLSSLFSPNTHGKDAALASLLASSSKPPVSLNPSAGLQPFGSFTQSSAPKKPTPSQSKATSVPKAHEASSTGLTLLAAKEKQAKKAKLVDHEPIPPNQSASKPVEPVPTRPDQVSIPHIPAGRKAVFRPVLASSTMVSWPEMPAAGSQTVLHTLLDVLAAPDLKQIVQKDLGRMAKPSVKEASSSSSAVARPAVLAGINSITRQIEGEIAHITSTAGSQSDKGKTHAGADRVKVRIVFVCRHDGSPLSLFAHLPMLTCAMNAVKSVTSSRDDVILFPLPAGSEALLAKAVGLRRCSAIALTSDFPPKHLTTILSAVAQQTGTLCHLKAPWLTTAVQAAAAAASSKSITSPKLALARLEPATIKFLRTTQPVDLNACKALKKSMRKLRASRWKERKFKLQNQIKRLQRDIKQSSAAARLKKQRSKPTHTPV